MKRLLYFSQYYATSAQPGASRHYQHIQHLMRHGYQVTLVTSYVKNRLRVIPPEYAGTKIAVERDGDLLIYKVYAYPHYGSDFGSRMRNYLSYMLYAIIAGVKSPPCDLVFASSPSLFVGVAGYLLSLLRRVPLVLEIRDLWPETPIIMGALRNPLVRRMAEWLERFLYRRARLIVAVTSGIKNGIVATGTPESKIVLIPNGVDDDLFGTLVPEHRTRIRNKYSWDGRFVAIYAGTLARSDGLGSIVGAAAQLASHKDVLVAFLGDGEVKPDLVDRVEKLALRNVVFIPSCPKSEVPGYIGAADVCLMPVKRSDFFSMALPNKLFDYMAGGRPVIAAVPTGEAQALVEEAGAGVVVPPEDVQSLSAALLALRDDPEACRRYGDNGRTYVMKRYLRSGLASRLVAEIDRVLEQGETWQSMSSDRAGYGRLKSIADPIVAGLALIPLWPVFMLIGLLIRLDSRGPIFFRQERAGKGRVSFRVFKFRTMHHVSGMPIRGAQAEDDPRITRVGRWLRRFSLDELPQLINVLRGEMSVIGPRPALPHQVERYDEFQMRRLEVRPGMTGWAQVNGRNSLTWEEKIELDVWYVDHLSLRTDLSVLLRTPMAIIDQSSVYFRGKGSAWKAPAREELQSDG